MTVLILSVHCLAYQLATVVLEDQGLSQACPRVGFRRAQAHRAAVVLSLTYLFLRSGEASAVSPIVNLIESCFADVRSLTDLPY